MKKWQITYYVGVAVIVLAILGIVIYVAVSYKSKSALDSLREDALISDISTNETVPYPEERKESVVVNPDTGVEEIIYVDPGLECPVDFFTLWNSNSDIYGWLRIPGTVIDYPVLQHAGNYDDSNYYLRKDLDGNYSTAGNLYSQNYYNSDFVNDGITVIYGHNMRNETMFGTLDFYIDEDGFVDSHKYMYFYTAYNSYRYRVVAVLVRPNDNIMKLYSGVKDSEGDFSDFLTDFNTGEFGDGYVEDGFLVKKDDKFLMLSTCLSDYSERMIVVAVREEMK